MNMLITSNLGTAVIASLCMLFFWRSLNLRLASDAARPSGMAGPFVRPAVSLTLVREAQSTTDVRELLDETPQLCDALLRSGALTWSQNSVQGALQVVARRQELQQLLAHIVAIACHAMPRGGVLNVLALTRGDEAVIEFTDAGIDQQEPLLAGLFLHGSRTPQVAAHADSGLMISVASCRRIVDGHGGRIDLTPSAASGGRLALTIRLPLRAEAANSPRY